jgi:hypothetical protein
MPRRKITEYVDGEPEKIVVPDAAEESYEQFLSKWGRDGAKVRVYRMTPQGRQYCFVDTPENVDQEALRIYHAKQTFAHETGSYQIEIEVNGETRPPFHILIAPQTSAPGVPESASSGPMAQMFQMLQAQNERLERQLSQMQQTTKEPIGEIADALLKLDQLRGGQQKELPLDSLIKAIQLGKEMGGGGETDWTVKLLDVVKDSMPALQGLFASMAARANGNGGVEMNEEALLKQGIAFLKKKALAGSNPELYVGVVVDNQEEPLYGRLIHKILETDFSAFAALDADIGRPEYEPFFRALYNGVRSCFIEANTVEADTGGASGNTGDRAADGEAGKRGRKKS